MSDDSSEEGIKKQISPALDELYIILLDNTDKPCVYIVSEVNEKDNVVILNNTSNKDEPLLFELSNSVLNLQSTKLKYKIFDIERVISFDLDILKKDKDQLDKQLTSDIIKGLDISLEDINEKDIVFTDIELRESLVSELIFIFNAYDKYKLIEELMIFVDDYLLTKKTPIKEYLYNITKDKLLPKWLIPIVDNPLKLYINGGDTEDAALDELNEIQAIIPTNTYYQNIQHILNIGIPFEPSLSDIGVITNKYSNNYVRDCLQSETCLGIKGNYRYDRRKNKRGFSLCTDDNKRDIHQADTLNIVGLLYIPDNKLIYGLDITSTSLSMKEKTTVQTLISSNYRRMLHLKDQPMVSKTLDHSIKLSQLDTLIHYSLSDRIDEDVFYELVRKLAPNVSQLLQYIDDDIKSKLLNYKDIKTLFVKYNIHPENLNKADKQVVNELLSNNIKSYLGTITKLSKVLVTIKHSTLSIHQKISLSKQHILNLHNIPKRNAYLQIFIKNFTRESISSKEDKLWLYNIYTNERILCKHYLFSSIYHTDKSAHESMISIYGKPAEDGVIYCKQCSEYLSDEAFSAFDGFIDDAPIQLREVLKEDLNLLEGFKGTSILLVKLLGKNVGVILEDIDIKLILSIHSSFDENIIANTRYGTINITETDEHPRIKDIMEQFAKKKKKSKLLQQDINNFRTYLKDTNKLLSLISIIILVTHTSIPKYNFKNNSKLTFLEIESIENISFNKKLIDYCIQQVNKNIDIYKSDPLWDHYKRLTNEHKTYPLPTIKDQIMNIIHYLISPQYPVIRSRIIDYGNFLRSSEQSFIRSEWPIFKPLKDNKLIKEVDKLLVLKHDENKGYYILNYNNYPVENISLLEPITNNKCIYELLKIPISEIMINKSFLLLFKICVSNYGKSNNPIDSIDLHIENFLQTIHDKESIELIFTKHGWKSSHERGYISYQELRTKIIPDIITHYQKSKQDIQSCYDTPNICNRFIHIHINNYELFLLKGAPKRHYKYIQDIVFPDDAFDELSEEFRDKIFKRYCKDPSDNIITKTYTNNYLGKAIINVSGEIEIQIPDYISEYEIVLDNNSRNLQKILQTIQSNILPLDLYIKPKEYGIDDYNLDIYKRYFTVEQNILDVFRVNNYYELGNDHPIIQQLTHYIEYIQGHDSIDKTSISRDLELSFSSLTTDDFTGNISLFISQCQSKFHKKRFENIFINTSESINISSGDRTTLEGDGFRYKNLRQQDIQKILELFSNDSRLTSNSYSSYIYRIKVILSKFKNDSITSNYIPKQWKLSATNKTNFKEYITNNLFVLHSDLFTRKVHYKGFHEYQCRYIFDSLLDYISPYVNDLYKLRTNEFSLVNPVILFILNKYTLLFILNKLVEFHSKLIGEDESILSLLEANLRKLPEYEELNIIECSTLTENIIMDLITEILQIHYDSRWIISNTNQSTLTQRLSKQKEREKQTLINKLDTMGDDKRASTMELQTMGVTNQFKASAEANAEFMQSEENKHATDVERYNTMNTLFEGITLETYASGIITGEIDESNNAHPVIPVPVEDGYFNEQDLDEEGEMVDEAGESNRDDY